MSDLPPLPDSGPEAPLLFPPELQIGDAPDEQPTKAAKPPTRRGPSQSSVPPNWRVIVSFFIAAVVLVTWIAIFGSMARQETRSSANDNTPPSQTSASTEALFRGIEEPIRFGTPTFIRLGGADTSVWRVVVEAPRAMGSRSTESNFRIDVTMSLESSTASGVVELPGFVGGFSERWRVSWGGLTRAPDQDQCSEESNFVALPQEIRLRVGEQLTGSLCLEGPSFLPTGMAISNWYDIGVVELQTALGRITFKNEGRDQGRIEINGSLSQIAGRGYAFDVPVKDVIDAPDVWDVVIGVPSDAEGRSIGDPDLGSSEEILLLFPVSATLIDTPTDEHGRFFILSYIIGGHSGTRYDVRIGDERCPNDWDIEIGWAQVGYRMDKVACVEISGADAASPATVFAVSHGFGDLALFRVSNEPPTPARIPEAVTPPGRDLGEPFLVDRRFEIPATEWTIVSVSDAASDDDMWRNVTIQTAAEPSIAEANLDGAPFTVHVLGGATRLVHSTPCAATDVQPHDTFCVQLSDVDVNHPETRYVLQVRYDFVVFDATGS